MTPKEKAEELVDKFTKFPVGISYVHLSTIEAKQCALIAVDEVIKAGNLLEPPFDFEYNYPPEQTLRYWQAVRSEIEKL